MSSTRMTVRGAWPIVALAVAVLLVGGCGPKGKPAPAEDGLSGSDLDQAQRLFSQLSRAYAEKLDRQVLDLTASLLDFHPTFGRNDEAVAMAVVAAERAGDPGRALGLVDEMLVRFPYSPSLLPVLERGSELARTGGDTLRAAGYLLDAHDLDPKSHATDEGRPLRHDLFEALAPEDVATLVADHPRSGLVPYLSYLRAAALLERESREDAERVVSELQARHPGDPWAVAAADLLAGGRGWRGQWAEVDPDLVGVLCPLTGRYAVLGNAFYDAALLAVEAANAELDRSFTLVAEDSAGDPVRAAQATRRLVNERGVVALVGSLTSGPTTTAAVVADHLGVPLVSPTATNDNIWELGRGIFQVNLTSFYEIRMMAQLATTVMLKSRFAILYPDNEEGLRHAEVFRNVVEELGGVIVAEEGFPDQTTDFKDPILSVRAARPEVLFAPATVDQMILLGPQLDFYRMGSIVMGLSNWNSPKLAERSGTVLERALFPDDLILFPQAWTADFESRWRPDNYPREATALALKTYQATRMLLDTMGRGEALGRQEVSLALEKRLANRDFEVAGPETYGRSVRMFLSEEIVGFPAGNFRDSWALTEGAMSDSLTVGDESPDAEVTGRPGRE